MQEIYQGLKPKTEICSCLPVCFVTKYSFKMPKNTVATIFDTSDALCISFLSLHLVVKQLIINGATISLCLEYASYESLM